MELKYYNILNYPADKLAFNRTAYGIEIRLLRLGADSLQLLIAPLMELKWNKAPTTWSPAPF